MTKRAENLIVNGAIAALGATALVLKGIEAANAWVRWQAKG